MGYVLTVLLLLQQGPKIDEPRVRELVEKCGAEEIAEREAATGELLAMGEAVLPFLEKAAASAKGETRARVEKVIAELALPARWAKEVLDGDPNQGYQRLENALRTRELDKPQATRVAAAILLNDGASPEMRQYVLNLAERHRLRDLWPAVLQLVGKEDGVYENYGHYLTRLRPPPEAAGAILKLIPKLQSGNSAYQLLEVVRSLRPERAAMEECLGAILDGDDANLKGQAINLIQQGRFSVSLRTLLKWWRAQPAMRAYPLREALLKTPPTDGLDDLMELLKSPQPEDTSLVIDYVGRQRVVAAAAPLVKALDARPELRAMVLQSFRILRCEDEVRSWITGPGGPGRRAAIALAGELGWTALGPEVARGLADDDPAVRREAAMAAGQLRIAEAAPKLALLLQDPGPGVRRAALLSLAIIQGREATKVVLAHLRSDDSDLQAAAIESLPLVDTEAVLADLTSDEGLGRAITRYALANLIVKGGPSMLHRVMARVKGKVSADDLHAQIRLIQAVPVR